MKLSQFAQFKTVAECENISQAAQLLFTSQAALTKSLQRFEKELGFQLFDRVGKRIVLNDRGRLVLDAANNILAIADAMKEQLQSLEGGKRHIRLDTNLPNITRYITPAFRMKNPDILLSERYHNVVDLDCELLEEGGTDVLITTRAPEGQKDVCCELLCRDRFTLMVPESSPLSARNLLSIENIRNVPIVLPDTVHDTCPVQKFLQLAGEAEIPLEIFKVPDVSAMEYLLRNSKYATLSSEVTNLFFQFPDRVPVPLAGSEYSLPYYMIYLQESRKKIEPLRKWVLQETDSWEK